MTLAMGIVGVIGLLIVIAVGSADLGLMFKTMRRDRTRVVAPRPVRAIDPQTQARLAELAGQGNTIQAIKDLRVATGLGLNEANDAVDAIAAGHDVSGVLLPRRDVPATTEERARELIAQGRKIQAIKLIREEAGVDLMEAKNVADGLSGVQVGTPTN
jgi:ribosomal protein L7/L12